MDRMHFGEHSSTQFNEALESIRNNLMEMGGLVEKQVVDALQALLHADSDLAQKVLETKAVSDLERIGDESAKIARMGQQLAEEGESPRGYVEVRHIGNHVRNMLRDTLDAFARFDAKKALAVAAEDNEVDMEYRSAMRSLVTFMMEDPRSITRILNIIWSLRALERIGDHARNIGEQVIYLVEGKDVRHITVDEIEAKLKK